MKTQNANIDFCGIVNLLQYLMAHGHCTEKEAQKISERVPEKLGTDIITFIMDISTMRSFRTLVPVFLLLMSYSY